MLSKSKIKYIQTLGQKKFRQEEGCFVAEGPKIVAELLEAKREAVLTVYAVKEWISENQALAGSFSCEEISERIWPKFHNSVRPIKYWPCSGNLTREQILL